MDKLLEKGNNVTTKTIIILFWGKVQEGEWGMSIERVENAMNAACAVVQHVDMIPGVVIAVKELLHLQNAAWPHWMAMIKWMHKLVTHHAWVRNGRIVHMAYKFGTTSNNDKEGSQQPEEILAGEEEMRGAEILEMRIIQMMWHTQGNKRSRPKGRKECIQWKERCC
ncbi:hypothetical protein PAXRUDRAFT_180340 [Paxillus rubicundulus Ve08.2h10]|uniref:Uncharacterized protein n=1 Tax=Paxillus rubicundulus Ve08.2h10 TaxID=930991 RepID=A0A0D0D6R8_9AGAM|nr:hypothetical protein PAXRUDRAFT_180340 [Paxillus rubicundulus Ve08.2h10]